VTVTQTAAVWELAHADPAASRRTLFSAGLRIGREHVSAAVNTLVLAYAGASLPLLLLFAGSGQGPLDTVTTELVAQEVVRASETRGHEALRIGASSTPGLYLLPLVLSGFSRRFPNVKIQFVLSNTERTSARLIENALDIGLVGSPVSDGVLAAEPLVEDEIVCVVHARHRLARRRSVPVAELRDETFVLREEGSSTRKLFIEWIRANGGTVGDTIDVTCPEAVKSLAQAGLGVGVLSAHAVADRASRSRLAIVRVDAPKLTRKIWVVMHSQKYMTRSLSGFRSALADASHQW